jgi:glutamyl-tRNA synthetase
METHKVRLRFAPSPTGPLHMGGVRTALYSYLYAKKHDGDFILRIEDTDQNRFVPGAEQYIIDALTWCGILPNEGVGFGDGKHAPYRQSERKPLYQQYAQQLVDSGHAYYAFDTAADMEQKRKQTETQGKSFIYDAVTRLQMQNSLSMSADTVADLINKNVPYVIRLKVTPNQEIAFDDLVRGHVVFNTNVVDDKVLLKSDGMPTYHLAHIVDDYLMQITHAVRGEEWLPSAPAHILIYTYLGWQHKMPLYAHLPLLLKPDGNGKLSKRDGDRLGFPVFPLNWTDPTTGETSAGYRERGYMPEAFVNMLALLGWNSGTSQEVFTMAELIQAFSFDHIHKAGAKFDPEKAKWFNEQFVRALPDQTLALVLQKEVLATFNYNTNDVRVSMPYLTNAAQLLKPRIQFFNEMLLVGPYLFEPPTTYDTEALQKKWNNNQFSFYDALLPLLLQQTSFDTTTIETLTKQLIKEQGLKLGDVIPSLRIFVSGKGSGVDLFGMIALLGKDETLQRLQKALLVIKNQN